jgi:hypothetical protein
LAKKIDFIELGLDEERADPLDDVCSEETLSFLMPAKELPEQIGRVLTACFISASVYLYIEPVSVIGGYFNPFYPFAWFSVSTVVYSLAFCPPPEPNT